MPEPDPKSTDSVPVEMIGLGAPERPVPADTEVTPAPPPPPPAKASDKVKGKWAAALDKDATAALEKKFAKDKAKDKKIQAEADKLKETTLEIAADSLTLSKKGKAVSTFKFKIAKDEPTALTINGDGKDGKKDAPKEVTITLVDDGTITVKDWAAKDAAKAATWTFKK